MDLSVRDIAEATGGRILAGDPEWTATSFSYDSRSLESGACFFALQGNRDGHDFVRDAFERGALVAVVSRDPRDAHRPGARALILVDDTLQALGACGRVARERLVRATVVGITGSAGKTSTKDLAAAALSRRFDVLASPGSFNNESGLPLTLLAGTPRTEVVVAEMGARFPGNIRQLCEIARPRIGVITNIGLAHAAYLGDREAIARVKGELLDALPADGVAVVNADDDAVERLSRDRAFRVVPVGFSVEPERGLRVDDVHLDDDLRARFALSSPWGAATIRLDVRGLHQVLNAGLAAAVALVLGVPLDDVALGLEAARGASWRMQLEHSPAGVVVLNDAYNASPATVEAALRSFAHLPVIGRRVAVLGEMLELGSFAAREHDRLGGLAADLGVDALVAVGDGARPVAAGARRAGIEDVAEVGSVRDALSAVVERVRPYDAVLVKGSRAVGLEVVADALVSGAADRADRADRAARAASGAVADRVEQSEPAS